MREVRPQATKPGQTHLVEAAYLALEDEGASEAEELAFAAGPVAAALFDASFEDLRRRDAAKLAQEPCLAERGHDVVVGALAEGIDVEADCPREQRRRLKCT